MPTGQEVLDILLEEIEKSNAEFTAMTREQKRVQLARDVLQQMAAKRLVPTSTYLAAGRPNPYTEGEFTFDSMSTNRLYSQYVGDTNVELKDELATLPHCQVCGIGALFVVAVERLDDLTVRAFAIDVDTKDTQSAIWKYLEEKRLFTVKELLVVEHFFESGDDDYLEWRGSSYGERMGYISRRIIDTGGAEIVEKTLVDSFTDEMR